MFRLLRRLRKHRTITTFFTPRSFLLFGTQTPPEFLLNTIKFAFFGHLFWDHFYAIAPCGGPSMLPTLNVAGDWIVNSKLHALGKGVKVGDLVSCVHPREPTVHVLKRVIGMPGDFVLVDPSEMDTDWNTWIGLKDMGVMTMVQVPEGHCWVTGDNLPHSVDSRKYGPVPLGLIRGKAIAKIVWPRVVWLENGLKPAEEEQQEANSPKKGI